MSVQQAGHEVTGHEGQVHAKQQHDRARHQRDLRRHRLGASAHQLCAVNATGQRQRPVCLRHDVAGLGQLNAELVQLETGENGNLPAWWSLVETQASTSWVASRLTAIRSLRTLVWMRKPRWGGTRGSPDRRLIQMMILFPA